ncbi:mitotic checkpoint serine/threonine-protein kinase BUB1 beta isoform X2 [Chelmon rostratus]|uniref:mitotic checkpoint serine/threonine-protein kinase BUB1 beta isoform X2 n=1 Tax=Chelmon rostratus TaxID=109905 RepID=UPI001BEAF8FB|nr:mitotic checkpoint serine/threonine-protein kinase BUB1 beta isoform X2 [Chelmon rostratus]
MAEGLQMQVGSTGSAQSAYQSWWSSETHLSGGAGLQEEGRTTQRSEYCKELLMRGGEEFSLEELRAQRHDEKKQQELDKKLSRMVELKEQLSLELEEKKKLLLLRRSQPQVLPEGSTTEISDCGPAAPSFQIYDESHCAAARPAGNELQDDVFLRPDERGLCLRVQHPRPRAVGRSEPSKAADVIQSRLQNANIPSAPQNDFQFSSCSTGHQGGTTEDTQSAVESGPPVTSQKPVSKTRKKLSPIQETSVEAGSLTSLGGCTPLEEVKEDQDKEEMDHAPSPVGGAVDPCDTDVRRRLLEICDVTSSSDVHSDPCPLPAVEEHSCLQLGGKMYLIYNRVLDGGSFSIYKGTAEDDNVVIKVDSCSVPWDFHQFQRLKNSSAADSLPLISCFLYPDGCITVYTIPTHHMFTELTESVPSEWSVGHKAVGLLQLVSQLHSCRLLHAALQPNILTCFHRGFLKVPDWVFPLDWSSSVDLDLQQGVTSVRQVPSAQDYISLGLLEPNAPPQLVDLVGVAETVHVLLTNSRMVAVKDDGGWTAEQFRGDEPCDMFSRMWRRFFRALLNVGSRSSLSVLSELKDQLSTLYH